MKLQPDRSPQQTVISLAAGQLITSHGHRAEDGVMLTSEGAFHALKKPTFGIDMTTQLNGLPLQQLEVLIIGTGVRHHLFPPIWRIHLSNPSIGIESMTTSAACRTFNVLSLEGRKAALWAMI